MNSATDVVARRVELASRNARHVLVLCLVVDATILFLWGTTVAISFGYTNDGAQFLTLTAGTGFLAATRLALASAVRSCTQIRVDRIANAPTLMRRVAYMSYHPALGWWAWCGYVGGPLNCSLGVALSVVYAFVFGFTATTLARVFFANCVAAAVSFRITTLMYSRGIDASNKQIGVDREWVEYSRAAHMEDARNLIVVGKVRPTNLDRLK